MSVRGLEHLEFKNELPKSEIKNHMIQCVICKQCNLDSFDILKNCKTDLESKIFEAIYIKKEMPKLNKNLFNSGSLYTLKVYL